MKRYCVGPIQIDPEQRLAYRDGRVLPLQPKEFSVLQVLVESAGTLVSRDTLCERVWHDELIEEANLSKKVSRLRRILREQLGEDPIETFSKLGYRFVAPVTLQLLPDPHPPSQAASAPRADGVETVPSTEATSPSPISPSPTGPGDSQTVSPWYVLRTRYKRSITIAFILVFVFTAGASLDHRRSIPASPLATKGRPSLAILGFKNLSDQTEEDWIGTALRESLGSDLAASDGVRLVSGEREAEAEQDLGLAPMRSYEDKTIQTVGKRLDCDFVLVGFYLSIDGNIRFDLQMRDARTGVILSRFSQIAPRDNLLQTVADAGASLRKDLGLPPMEVALSNALPNIDSAQEAMRDYAAGLQLLRQDKPREAQPLLSKAVAVSPLSPLAHCALAQAWYHMGEEEKAAGEARLALTTAAGLPTQQKLALEASAYTYLDDWPKAMETYAALRKLHPDDLDYALGFANAQIGAGSPKESLQTLRTLVASSRAAANDPRVSQAEFSAAGLFDDWRTSLYYAGEALRLARATSARTLEINALIAEGNAWSALGNGANAIADFHSAEQLAASIGDLDRLSEALQGLGNEQEIDGDPAAIVTLRRALDIDRKLGDRLSIMNALNSLGNALADVQDWSEARQCYQEIVDTAMETKNLDMQALGLGGLTELARLMGNFDLERTYASQTLSMARKAEDNQDQAYAHLNLAQVDVRDGDLAAARTQLKKALDIANQVGQPDIVADSLTATADFEMADGDLASARKHVDQALAMHVLAGPQLSALLLIDAELKIEEGHPEAVETPMSALAARSKVANPGAEAYRLVAESRLLRGDTARARIAIDMGLALARESPNTADYLIPDSLVAARIDASEGHGAKALSELSPLLARAQRIKDMELQLRIRLAQGQIEKQMGNLSQSRAILQSVQAEANQHGFGLIAQQASRAE